MGVVLPPLLIPLDSKPRSGYHTLLQGSFQAIHIYITSKEIKANIL